MIRTEKRNIGSILADVSKIRKKDERKQALRQVCTDKAVAIAIQYAYHPDVIWELPEGDIPDTLKKKVEQGDWRMLRQILLQNKLKYCQKSSVVSKAKKEYIFLDYYFSCDEIDRPILLGIKDKKLPVPYLTEKFCMESLPELFPAKDE
jgi:hypothetical protein